MDISLSLLVHFFKIPVSKHPSTYMILLISRYMQLILLKKFFLSYVNSNILLNVCFPFERSIFMSILLRSCLVVFIQVVSGLPPGFFTSLRYSSRAFLAGVTELSHIKCPSHVSPLPLITWLHGSHFLGVCVERYQ